jgi:hypothetical protein
MELNTKQGLLKRLHIPYIKEKLKPKEWTAMEKHVCIECKVEEARYWNDQLCEDCFREILREENRDEAES